MAAKKEKEIRLEDILWNCCNYLRGKVEKADNRNAVLGLVFLKFAGDKFEERKDQIVAEHGEIEAFINKPAFYLSENVFYLEEECRWSFICENASKTTIASILDKAMAKIEEDNEYLHGALPQRFYSNLRVESRVIKSLIDEINKISKERFDENDLIGRVYEYFLRVFAKDEGKAGEFYTPKSIVELIAELIEPYSGRIYDPCCGSRWNVCTIT